MNEYICIHCGYDRDIWYAHGDECDGDLHCIEHAVECDQCNERFCTQLGTMKEMEDGTFLCEECRDE